MNLAQVTEYQVQVFRFKSEEKLKWKAQVIAFPQFIAEGNSREAVLEEIEEQLATLEAESEIVNIPIQRPKNKSLEVTAPLNEEESMLKAIFGTSDSTPQLSDEELDAKLKAMGYEHFGIFADDPGALEVFDEIERLRDQHLIGG